MFTGPQQLLELVRQSARECSLMLFTKRVHNNRVSNKNRIIFKSLQLGYTMTQKNDPYIKMCSTLYGVGLRLFGVLNFITIKYFCTSLVKPFYAENNYNVPLKCNRVFMFCNLSFFLSEWSVPYQHVQYFIKSKTEVLNFTRPTVKYSSHKCSKTILR